MSVLISDCGGLLIVVSSDHFLTRQFPSALVCECPRLIVFSVFSVPLWLIFFVCVRLRQPAMRARRGGRVCLRLNIFSFFFVSFVLFVVRISAFSALSAVSAVKNWVCG